MRILCLGPGGALSCELPVLPPADKWQMTGPLQQPRPRSFERSNVMRSWRVLYLGAAADLPQEIAVSGDRPSVLGQQPDDG